MKRINILFVVLQMGKMGGSERLVCDILKGLDYNRFNPSIAWFYEKYEPLDEIKELNIPYYFIPKKRRIDLNTMRDFSNLIKNKKIDIVNAHHFMSFIYLVYGCKIKNQVKLIYTEHSEWEIERIGFKWRLISKYLMNKVDKIVCVNEKMIDAIKKKFGILPPKVISIRNGVAAPLLLDEYSKASIKRELGIGSDYKTIAIVANLKKVKNHIYLIDAFADLLEHFPNVKLLIIGQGFENDPDGSEFEVRKRVQEKELNDCVLFLGYRNNVQHILSAVDIFCLVSIKEGTPISLIEAMVSGIPVIGTNVEGIREIIINGNNGYLVDINDSRELTNHLYNLLTNDELRNRFGLKARQFALVNYSLSKCINQYQSLFYEVVYGQ